MRVAIFKNALFYYSSRHGSISTSPFQTNSIARQLKMTLYLSFRVNLLDGLNGAY